MVFSCQWGQTNDIVSTGEGNDVGSYINLVKGLPQIITEVPAA
jgi:hypothetical protein